MAPEPAIHNAKLPSYRPPTVTRIRTPSPPPPPGSTNNAVIAAVGCEIIVRDITPTQGHTSLAQIQIIINQVAMEQPDLLAFPVRAEGSGLKESISTYCYVRLADEVRRLDARPRPDLLWTWAEKIKETKPEWDVGWSPQPRKDKRLWVRIAETGEVSKEDKAKLQAVEKECQSRGYTVQSVFPMRDSVTVILTRQEHAQALIENGITIPILSPHPLPAYPFRQLEPQWAFELVITGISRYDHEIVYALDQYIHHTFVDPEKNSLLQGTRTLDDCYCFTMHDWQATRDVILKAESIENHFAQQKLSKPTLVYQHNMGGTYVERRGTSDEVKKAANKLGLEVDAMRRDMDEMRRETRQGFAAANQKFDQMNTNMSVITTTLSTLHSQLQNTTHAMLGQREEKMISDKAHAIDMRLFDLERMLDRAQNEEEKSPILAKMKHLQETREHIRNEYENIGAGITNILTGPVQAALPAPIVPPGLPNPMMPPPPHPTPSTPTAHRNNVMPPTPAPTPVANNGKRTEVTIEDPSPTKRLKITTAATRSSPRSRPARTSSESSVENAVVPKAPKKPRKDRSLSVTTGSDVFGPTDPNVMVVDQAEKDMVSVTSSGENAQTNRTCNVHPAPRMMLSSFVSDGFCVTYPERSAPLLYSSVENNVSLLRVDHGCTAGLNKSFRSDFSKFRPHTPRFTWILFLVWSLSLLQYTVATPTLAHTLSIYALNANGFVSPPKIHHVSNVIRSRRPHVFVISETKTSAKMGTKLSTLGYNVYEETGIRCTNHHISKWGIIVGVRNDIQVSQPVGISHASLSGRVVAVDVTLCTTSGRGFTHRIIGAYAPWNPGVNDGDFWVQVAKVCQGSQHSWTLAGDLNATISSVERPSGGTDARGQFVRFLDETEGVDLWETQPDRNRERDWTCRARGAVTGGNIIDRVVASRNGFSDGEIHTATRDFIPGTDHRAVFALINIVPPPHLTNETLVFATREATHLKPRIRYPTKAEKHKFEDFRTSVDKMALDQNLAGNPVVDSDSFITRYKILTNIFDKCATSVFGHIKPYRGNTNRPITSVEIRRILSKIRNVRGAIRLASNPDGEVSINSILLYNKAHRDFQRNPDGHVDLRSFLIKLRKNLYKDLYRERMEVVTTRAREADKKKIAGALLGGSTRKLVIADEYIGLPNAVNLLDGSGEVITDPDKVKQITRDYFQGLYHHEDPPDLPKPWMQSPSVIEIKDKVVNDPFIWPRLANVEDFRAMIRRGNHRPAPGPDGWEKWIIKNLSDYALSLVMDLLNFITIHSHFPGNIKDMRLTMFHKRGIRTNLTNWRGLMISNFMANAPMTWLNYLLIPYAAKKLLIPDTQVATQQGVQTRDVMSYLSAVKSFANRHKQTVYALQRDQMKGFDYLHPQGFYDAITAYGLPLEIIKLDKAAQKDTRVYIRTAHGTTGPIVINGVTKQGGPLSPLKSTMTTSLGHRYLDDMTRSSPDTLIIGSKFTKHSPVDSIRLPVTMVEATDDSYIFALTLQALSAFCLEMERFQYAYGWLTQWAKTYAYILCPSGPTPDTVSMPSITIQEGIHPHTIKWYDVPLRVGELEFLRCKVDDPVWRFDGARSIIKNFKFPKFTVRTPITLLRKIIWQNLTSRLRALLSIQPVKPNDASKLDKLIAAKIHNITGFPYCPNTDILTLPVDLHGLDFPSLARINAGIATEGLWRDLNHHVPAYRNMARLTLADWRCMINHCIDPLDGKGLSRDFTGHYRKIPAAWIIAHKVLTTLEPNLALRTTDCSHILRGEVSLLHVLNIAKAHGSIVPDGRAIKTLVSRGINCLSDIGKWHMANGIALHFKSKAQPPTGIIWSGRAMANWMKITQVLNNMNAKWFSIGDVNLMTPKEVRKLQAESYITTLAKIQRFPPSRLPHNGSNWASDGSMIPAASGIGDPKSVTAALTGPRTLILRVIGRNTSILQGELIGLVAGLLMAAENSKSSTLHTDHLNSVRIIQDIRSMIGMESKLRSTNGRSYYRWIEDLVKRTRTVVNHVKSHTDAIGIGSWLNAEADHYASKAQSTTHLIPIAPIPTFFMEDFAFYREVDGWIESNIHIFTDYFLAKQTAKTLTYAHHHRMATWLYDHRTHPTFPYMKASSAYSALVQLYARSGQLPTASNMNQKNKNEHNGCRYGCSLNEDMYHVFVRCGRFEKLREEAVGMVVEKVERRIQEYKLQESHVTRLRVAAKFFFCDSEIIWPLHYSAYYLGHVPKLDALVSTNAFTSNILRARFLHNLHGDFHLSGIRLASRIWGIVQKDMARRRDGILVEG